MKLVTDPLTILSSVKVKLVNPEPLPLSFKVIDPGFIDSLNLDLAIEAMPMLEAFPDEAQIMKYKLVTLPRGTSKLPVISLGYNVISLRQGATLTITPQTLNYLGSTSTNESNGYTATIADIRLMSTFNGAGVNASTTTTDLNTTTGTKLSKSVLGTSFTLTATTINTLFGTTLTQLSTTLTVIGRDSGARITIPVNIIKVNNL